MNAPTKLLPDRLRDKSRHNSESGCREWTAGKGSHGYGTIYVKGKYKLAHRVSYELVKGEIPSGLVVCHHCDNRLCINPDHLFLGTHGDNVADKVSKGRQRRGSGVPTSKLRERDIITILASEKSTNRELAEKFNTSHQQISRIRTGKHWGHIRSVDVPIEVSLNRPLAVHLCRYAMDSNVNPETIIAEAVRVYLGDA